MQAARLGQIDISRLSGRVRPRVKPRGLPQALEPHLVWETRDVSEACQRGCDLLGPHQLVVVDSRPGDFYASYHAVRFRDVTLGWLDYTAAVRLSCHRIPDGYLVLVPVSSSSVMTVGKVRGEANALTAALPPAGQSMAIDCERPARHLLVRIEDRPLNAHLERILGRPLESRLVFEQSFDLSSARASRWNIAIQVLHAELLEADSLLWRGLGIGHLEEFLMSALLFAHSSNYSEHLSRTSGPTEHRAVRVAKDFIEANLANPLTVGAVAAAAGVSERTLQAAFQADAGTTPMAYVRQRRLERARADLADAAPADYESVTSVATRWHLGHLGRFSADYSARFGESPSQTLHS